MSDVRSKAWFGKQRLYFVVFNSHRPTNPSVRYSYAVQYQYYPTSARLTIERIQLFIKHGPILVDRRVRNYLCQVDFLENGC